MHSNALRRAVFTLIGLAAASTASAGTITTWTGTAANNRWATSGNWTTAVNTTGTFSLVFTGTPANINTFNNVGAVKVDSIEFRNNGSTGQTSRFTLSNPANTLSLTAGGSVTSTAAVSGTLQDTISTNLSLLGSGTFNLGSNHNLLISGTLNTAGSLVKTGAGSLFLQGATTLGGLRVDQATVQFNGTAATAIDGLVADVGSSGNAGTIVLSAVGTANSSSSYKLRGNANIFATNFSNVTFTSGTFNVADATVTSPVTLTLGGGGIGNLGTQTVQGVIQDNSGSGTVGVTIGAASDTNVWVLKGNNTYTGATSVSANTKLLMDGVISASSTTTSSGYLGGTGTFGGAVTILSGSLAPGGTSTSGGVITDTIGRLTVDSLSLSSPATTAMTISGSTAGAYDQIAGSTSVNYGGTLALTLSGSYVDQTTFALFSGFTSQTGTFSAITLSAVGTAYDGLTFSGADANGDWLSTWNGNNQALKFSQSTGTLTVVPEPSTIVFAGIGMAMFGWSTWTRRRAKVRRRTIEAAVA